MKEEPGKGRDRKKPTCAGGGRGRDGIRESVSKEIERAETKKTFKK